MQSASTKFPGTNGWTGGQYSLFRFIFGTYLLIHFLHLTAWGAELYSNRGVLPVASASPLVRLFPNVLALYDAPGFVVVLLIVAAVLSAMFAVGWRDRIAAIGIWYLWACFFGRNPLTANPGLPYVGLMLLAHALLPPAPYGSLAARARVDPGGGWFIPQSIWAVVWILMAIGYTYSGLTKLASPSWIDGSAFRHVLENPLARPTWIREALLSMPSTALRAMTWVGLGLEIGFAPLAIFRPLRKWIWLAALAMHLSLMVLIDFADLSLGMVMLHGFTFNPAWVRARAGSSATIFYDGRCGLCHGFVRFVLAEDRQAMFRFAPLHGQNFESAIPADDRARLPDSIVVLSEDGKVRTRSNGVLFVLKGLGGAWLVIAIIAQLVPRVLRDFVYAGFARVRRHMFRAPLDACPMMPAPMRERFG